MLRRIILSILVCGLVPLWPVAAPPVPSPQGARVMLFVGTGWEWVYANGVTVPIGAAHPMVAKRKKATSLLGPVPVRWMVAESAIGVGFAPDAPVVARSELIVPDSRAPPDPEARGPPQPSLG